MADGYEDVGPGAAVPPPPPPPGIPGDDDMFALPKETKSEKNKAATPVADDFYKLPDGLADSGQSAPKDEKTKDEEKKGEDSAKKKKKGKKEGKGKEKNKGDPPKSNKCYVAMLIICSMLVILSLGLLLLCISHKWLGFTFIPALMP